MRILGYAFSILTLLTNYAFRFIARPGLQATAFAADLSELQLNLSAGLGLGVDVYVLIHDEDFDEYCLPDKITEVPATGRIKVKVSHSRMAPCCPVDSVRSCV